MRTIAALTGIVLFCSPALAGPEPSPGQPSAAHKHDLPILSGPKVSKTNVTGLSSTFSTAEQSDRSLARGAQMGLFRDAIVAMREAPEGIRPSARQTREIQSLVQAFQQRERAFQREHGRTLRTLRAQLKSLESAAATDRDRTDRVKGDRLKTDRVLVRPDSPPQRPGGADRMADTPMTDAPMSSDMRVKRASDLQNRIDKILALRPDPRDLEKPVRAILTAKQQAWVDEQIRTRAKELYEERAMSRFREQAQRQLAQQDKRLAEAIKRLPPRVREYIESLPPEQREAALRKLRDRRQKTDRPEQDRPARVIRKAPPSIDEVNVPKPSGGG